MATAIATPVSSGPLPPPGRTFTPEDWAIPDDEGPMAA